MPCLPLGPLPLVPLVISLAALALSLWFTLDCRFVADTFGIWYYNRNYGSSNADCQSYPTWNVNWTYTNAGWSYTKFSSIATTVVGAVVVIMLCFATCCVPLKGILVGAGVFSFFAMVFAFTTLVFKSSGVCNDALSFATLDTGRCDDITTSGIVCIVTGCLWFVNCILCCCLNKAIKDPEPADAEEDKDEMKKVDEEEGNGSKTTSNHANQSETDAPEEAPEEHTES